MSIKKSQIEDKSLSPNDSDETKPEIKIKPVEFNYPDHNITIKASSKKEADEKLKELINKK